MCRDARSLFTSIGLTYRHPTHALYEAGHHGHPTKCSKLRKRSIPVTMQDSSTGGAGWCCTTRTSYRGLLVSWCSVVFQPLTGRPCEAADWDS
eukprot:scaffold7228_cov523-Prasinococcus_capsulatus_cf.AAC.15